MIYKAAPIRAHRVEISRIQHRVIPINGFGIALSDLRVLSHFNEDQSMMQQYPSGSYSPASRTTNLPWNRSFVPFTAPQKSTVEHHTTPGVTLMCPGPSYDSPYMPDTSTDAYTAARKAYAVSTPDARYGSSSGVLPAYLALFHPPMLGPPSQHCTSPSAPSPISSVSPGPSPRKQELQIRMSQPCYEMGQRHHEILPLETGPFKK